jgi:hypothetical protein
VGTAVIGFVGVLIGALVSAIVSYHMQHRLWQRQESAKAYIFLFEAWDSLREQWRRVLNRLSINAPEEERRKRAQKAYEKAFAPLHRAFLNRLRLCRMLEAKPELRTRIKVLHSAYEEGANAVFFRIHNSYENTMAGLGGHGEAQRLLHSETITSLLESLRETVTQEYFHDSAEDIAAEDILQPTAE